MGKQYNNHISPLLSDYVHENTMKFIFLNYSLYEMGKHYNNHISPLLSDYVHENTMTFIFLNYSLYEMGKHYSNHISPLFSELCQSKHYNPVLPTHRDKLLPEPRLEL